MQRAPTLTKTTASDAMRCRFQRRFSSCSRCFLLFLASLLCRLSGVAFSQKSISLAGLPLAARRRGFERLVPRTSQSATSKSGAVISHTEIQVPPPWDDDFEGSWSAPASAVGGMLLRGSDGVYIAAVEWASHSDYESWLSQSSKSNRLLQAKTVLFERRAPSSPKDISTSSSSDTSVAGAPAVRSSEKSAADSFFGGFSSGGDDPEMTESEEVMFHGGDPSFLDESLWKAPQKSEKTYEKPTPSVAKPAEEKFEWDGFEDDTAHLIDE